ncbi:M10 family metallopeptidase [uncultured Tateyamaria sp.]|uniref:M10 family metallopeptidase n=1 Tax=uncultured Tateyamaria sp. TaxID=455651 RepID=UPI00260CF086|nr:M10 family metallopeptidase [uncultured Tateyamaria sp.]
MMTQTFDPTRHTDGGSIFDGVVGDPLDQSDTNNLTSSEINSSVSVMVDSSVTGTISTSGEQDFFSVTFEAGKTYKIDGFGSPSGGGTINETDLHLFNSSGGFIEYDDFEGAGLDAQITYTATTTGTFYIMVDGYYSTDTGTYTLSIEETVALPPPGTTGTYEELAEFLKSGTNNGVEYTFDTSSSNVITVNISGLTAAGQQLALWAMDAWEMVANIDFQIVTSGEMITVDDEDSGAFAYYPNTGSTSIAGGDNTNGVELNVSKQWLVNSGTTLDSYSFQTYVHEFGHALGLNHLGDYNFTPGQSITYANDAYFTNDSWQMSVMSYFDQVENTSTNASFGYLAGPMIADIIAIQDFYGAPGSSGVTAGNTTFGLNSNIGNYLDELFTALATNSTSANVSGNDMAYTLYDQGGTDTIDLSFLTASDPANINLNDGTFSDIGTGIDVLGIAVGTMIENLTTGAGNDTLTGNELNNILNAGDGNDLVLSGTGNDTTNGGIGNDTLYGGGGNDSISAGNGNDEAFGGNGNDFLSGSSGFDLLGGGANNDTLYGGANNDTLWGSSGNDLIYGGTDNDLVGGGTNKDQIFGESGNDTLYGGGGQDTVQGGTENDVVGGGAGADVVNGDGGNDTLWGQAGNDTLSGGNGDDDIAGGGQGDLLQGQQGNDTLNGGFGNDTLFGGANDDVLNGNFGTDILVGGLGADTFVFDEGGAKTVSDFNGAEGDMLQIDDGLWFGATLSPSNTVTAFASVVGGSVVFDFGSGNTITLTGVSTTVGLSDHIEII